MCKENSRGARCKVGMFIYTRTHLSIRHRESVNCTDSRGKAELQTNIVFEAESLFYDPKTNLYSHYDTLRLSQADC